MPLSKRLRRCRLTRRLGVALAVLFLLTACSGDLDDEGLEPDHDLVDLLPAAEIVTEPRAITFSSRQDRRFLRSGWSRLERDRQRNRGFVWGEGDASTLDFHWLAPRAFDLRFEARPFNVPGAPPQIVAVSVNGSPVGEVELLADLATYTLPVPEESLLAGVNRLELAYRWHRSPRQVSGAGDRRSLAVAWYGIGFGGGEVGAPSVSRPSAPDESPRLFVPAGAEIAYHFELRPGSRLRLDGWAWSGGGSSGRLEIEQQAEHEDSILIADLEGSGRGSALPLPGDTTRLVRLTLRAIPPPDVTRAVGIELRAPSVWAPRAESPEVMTAAGEKAASAAAAAPARSMDPVRDPSAERPNIVLYLIDTLRADRLGCYGYPRPVSPRIDAFAETAVLFEQVVAMSSWTRSSMASIFSGKWPLAHGTNGRDDRLRGDLDILPDRLRTAGYATAAFVTNPNINTTFGFDRGFDDFVYLGKEAGSDVVLESVADWLDDRSGEEPFFLWVHTLDPHAPYSAPAAFSRRLAPGLDADAGRRSLAVLDDLQAGRRPLDDEILAQLEALYDASIAYNDHFFGALLDDLDARGLLAGSMVILLSDHGDEFHEHGNWQHGRALHAESIGVPLIIKSPAPSVGRRVAQPVRHVDLLPTVLDALALPPSVGVEGKSLLPLMTGPVGALSADDASPPAAFSYLHLDGPARVSVVDRGWKLIQRFEHGLLSRPRLYHVADDPKEAVELAARFPIRTGYLASLIRQKLAAEQGEAEPATVDEATRKALEALGYL